jgi:hypothetical protein
MKELTASLSYPIPFPPIWALEKKGIQAFLHFMLGRLTNFHPMEENSVNRT